MTSPLSLWERVRVRATVRALNEHRRPRISGGPNMRNQTKTPDPARKLRNCSRKPLRTTPEQAEIGPFQPPDDSISAPKGPKNARKCPILYPSPGPLAPSLQCPLPSDWVGPPET